jgi:hypothetical protein
MAMIRTEDPLTAVFRLGYTPFSRKISPILFEPVTDVMSHLSVFSNRHRAVMKKLSAMHDRAFAASEHYAPIVVVVLEAGRAVIRVEKTMPAQRFRSYHKARKIGTIGDLVGSIWLRLL